MLIKTVLTKIVLYATCQQLTAGVWCFGRLQSLRVFVRDEQGEAEFHQFLQIYPRTRLYLLVDAAEEDYRQESFAHSTGRARRELLARKLAQLYRTTEYRAAQFIEREADQRQADRFLMVALNRVDFLSGWLRIIVDQEAPLVGIYLLAMLSQTLCQQLLRCMQPAAPHVLLSERLAGGLRQSYFQQGRLRVSRWLSLADAHDDTFSQVCLAETQKTQLYLQSQRLINRDDSLILWLTDIDGSGMGMAAAMCAAADIRYQVLDLRAAARLAGMDAGLLKQQPALLHMHLLATGHTPANLAPTAVIKPYQLGLLRVCTHAASVTILISALVLGGHAWKKQLDDGRQLAAIALELQKQDERNASMRPPASASHLTGKQLKQIVLLEQLIRQQHATPERLMRCVSHALSAVPQIRVNRLAWQLSVDPALMDNEAASSQTSLPLLSTPMLAATAVSNLKTDPFKPESDALYTVAFINAEIGDSAADDAMLSASVQRLLKHFASDDAVAQVSLLASPINLKAVTSIRGSTAEHPARQAQRPTFQFKLILKPEVFAR